VKCLSIQLQPKIDTSFTEKDLIDLVRSIGRFPEIDAGDDNKGYINLNFFTEDLIILWDELKQGFRKNKELDGWINKVAIIVCESDNGRDDYLLLSHYDTSETLDKL